MLRDNLPPAVVALPELEELLAAEQPEIDRLDGEVEAMRAEFFVASLTGRTVDAWEDLFGFDHPSAWPLDRRRDRIAARLLTASPLTPASLKDTIERVGGVAVTLTERPDDPSVTVTFVGQYGIPRYLADIQAEVERIRPFHVPVDYAYSYVTLGQYAAHTLGGLSLYTLGQLHTGAPFGGSA